MSAALIQPWTPMHPNQDPISLEPTISKSWHFLEITSLKYNTMGSTSP